MIMTARRRCWLWIYYCMGLKRERKKERKKEIYIHTHTTRNQYYIFSWFIYQKRNVNCNPTGVPILNYYFLLKLNSWHARYKSWYDLWFLVIISRGLKSFGNFKSNDRFYHQYQRMYLKGNNKSKRCQLSL